MPQASKIMPKWMPKSATFQAFSKKAKTFETICFTIENVVLSRLKSRKNRSKTYGKSRLEKIMPKGAKISQKGAKLDTEIYPKWPKGANGGPKGLQKGEKDRKKNMPKTKPKKGGKMYAKRLGPAECAWPPQSAIMALPGLTRPIWTKA